MHTAPESPTSAPGPSHAARSLIDRLIAFRTVSRDSNLGLIEWARDYLHGHGAKTRLTYDATGKKANLFATLGDSPKPGAELVWRAASVNDQETAAVSDRGAFWRNRSRDREGADTGADH